MAGLPAWILSLSGSAFHSSGHHHLDSNAIPLTKNNIMSETSQPVMHEVSSSQIHSIGWSSGDKLTVRFHSGGIYEYEGVDNEHFHRLLNAPSVGKAFMEIKKNPARYPYRKIS